jgi:hypothetical protein
VLTPEQAEQRANYHQPLLVVSKLLTIFNYKTKDVNFAATSGSAYFLRSSRGGFAWTLSM